MLHLHDVSLSYGQTSALSHASLGIAEGEFVCLRGPSGSGKTTMLLLAGGMLRPTGGRVELAGQDLYGMTPSARATVRATTVGFVFQTFNLVPYLDLADNLRLAGGGQRSLERDQVVARLERVGLGHRATHKPQALSAGERQRTALLRAMMHEPRLLLVDEPTGNLDPANATIVMDLLSEFHSGGGTVLLVTHGILGDDRADRVLHLEDGRLVPQPTAAI